MRTALCTRTIAITHADHWGTARQQCSVRRGNARPPHRSEHPTARTGTPARRPARTRPAIADIVTLSKRRSAEASMTTGRPGSEGARHGRLGPGERAAARAGARVVSPSRRLDDRSDRRRRCADRATPGAAPPGRTPGCPGRSASPAATARCRRGAATPDRAPASTSGALLRHAGQEVERPTDADVDTGTDRGPWRAIQRSCFGLPRATPTTSGAAAISSPSTASVDLAVGAHRPGLDALRPRAPG